MPRAGSKWKQRYFTRGRDVTCASCHDVHGTEHNADPRRPAAAVCLQYHSPGAANGPHTKTIEQHAHHKAGSPGNECVACHMPKIAQEIGDVMVRSRTFKFIPPSATEKLEIPAIESLNTWPEFSPWRVGH